MLIPVWFQAFVNRTLMSLKATGRLERLLTIITGMGGLLLGLLFGRIQGGVDGFHFYRWLDYHCRRWVFNSEPNLLPQSISNNTYRLIILNENSSKVYLSCGEHLDYLIWTLIFFLVSPGFCITCVESTKFSLRMQSLFENCGFQEMVAVEIPSNII